jgi:DNA polymerase I-like protein with 3'-5' exonuclease and polymerase domains/uracil-DNA glycosylase
MTPVPTAPPEREWSEFESLEARCVACNLRTGINGQLKSTWAQAGDGSPDAQIALVGEALGEEEEARGVNFVGPAGRKLTQALQLAGLHRGDCWVCNAVRCLGGKAEVRLVDGTRRRIAWLVRHRHPGPVWSIDTDGQRVEKPIVGWYRSPLDGRAIVRLSYVGARGHPSGVRGVHVTVDHEVLARRGWVPAGELKPGDEIATGEPGLTPRIHEVLVGSLLGDGHITGRTRRPHFEASSVVEEWSRYRSLGLGGLYHRTATVPPGPTRPRASYRVFTRSAQALISVRAAWWPDGQKRVPTALTTLTPRAVAVWFLDDGHCRHRSPRRCSGEFAVHDFPPPDRERLAEMLRALGVACTVRGGRINLGVDGFAVLADMIGSYVPPALRYKLPESAPAFEPRLWDVEAPVTGWAPVDVQPSHLRPRDRWVYCLDVADTYNFVTTGGVVHNCRPHHPETNRNRKPSADEIDACHGYLVDELRTLHPKVIVCLGDTATYAVLGARPGGVLDSRGRAYWSETYQAWVVLSLHPAYVLRVPSQLDFLVVDLIKAKLIAETGRPATPAPVEYEAITTLDRAIAVRDEILRTAERMHFDWETQGHGGVHIAKSQGFCVSFAIRSHHAYVFPRYGENLRSVWGKQLRVLDQEVLQPLLYSDIPKGGWHVAFDNNITKTLYGRYPRNVVWCGMIAHHTLNNHLGERGHGLKIAADLYTDMGRYDDALDQWLVEHGYTIEGKPDLSNLWRAPEALVWHYNGADSDASLRLEDVLTPYLHAQGVWRLYTGERLPVALAHQDIDRQGVRINTQRLDEVAETLTDTLDGLEAQIRQATGDDAFNPASHPQVRAYLFEQIGLPILARTETQQPSTQEAVLKQLEEQSEVIPLILQHRAYAKLKGTYIDGKKGAELLKDGRRRALRAVLDEDGRARMNTRIHGTETFRFVTRRPFAIHTWPKTVPGFPSVRGLIIPDDDYLFLEADYVQQELAIQAILADQRDLIEALLVRKQDVHDRVMADLFGKSKADYLDARGAFLTVDHEHEYKLIRSRAKATNFMILYRGGAAKLALMTGCRHGRGDATCDCTRVAQGFIDQYYDRYPQVRDWQYDRIKEARTTGRVRTPFDSYRVLPTIRDESAAARLEAERQAVNAPIQISGAHVMARALLRVQARFRGNPPLRAPFPGRIVFTIHDQLNAQVRQDLLAEGRALMVQEMTKPFRELRGWGLRVDIAATTEWGGTPIPVVG